MGAFIDRIGPNPDVQAKRPGSCCFGLARAMRSETLPATRGPAGRRVARAVGWRHAAGGAQIVTHYQQVTRVDPDDGAVASDRRGETR
jgi:hypothetical protein